MTEGLSKKICCLADRCIRSTYLQWLVVVGGGQRLSKPQPGGDVRGRGDEGPGKRLLALMRSDEKSQNADRRATTR